MTSYDLSEHRSMHCLLLWSHYSIVYFITENFKNYAYSMILLIIKDLISNKITASSTVDYVEVTVSELSLPIFAQAMSSSFYRQQRTSNNCTASTRVHVFRHGADL